MKIGSKLLIIALCINNLYSFGQKNCNCNISSVPQVRILGILSEGFYSKAYSFAVDESVRLYEFPLIENLLNATQKLARGKEGKALKKAKILFDKYSKNKEEGKSDLSKEERCLRDNYDNQCILDLINQIEKEGEKNDFVILSCKLDSVLKKQREEINELHKKLYGKKVDSIRQKGIINDYVKKDLGCEVLKRKSFDEIEKKTKTLDSLRKKNDTLSRITREYSDFKDVLHKLPYNKSRIFWLNQEQHQLIYRACAKLIEDSLDASKKAMQDTLKKTRIENKSKLQDCENKRSSLFKENEKLNQKNIELEQKRNREPLTTGVFLYEMAEHKRHLDSLINNQGNSRITQHLDSLISNLKTSFDTIATKILNSQNYRCIDIKRIDFRNDKWEFQPDQISKLDSVFSSLVKDTTLSIALFGYTDSIGSENYNLTLADKRIKSVIYYFIQKGLSLDRISGISFGELGELKDKKRKVEIQIIQKK